MGSVIPLKYKNIVEKAQGYPFSDKKKRMNTKFVLKSSF